MSHDPRLPFQRRTLPGGVGTALRSAREARGETRAAVADAVGIRPRTLARIEREAQKPSWRTLDGLCDHLGVSVVALARRWMRDSLDVPSNPSSSPGLGLSPTWCAASGVFRIAEGGHLFLGMVCSLVAGSRIDRIAYRSQMRGLAAS